MDEKKIIKALIDCYLDAEEEEDEESTNEYLMRNGIDIEKFRLEMISLILTKLIEADDCQEERYEAGCII